MKIDHDKIRYFICNTNHPDYDQLVVDLEVIHKLVVINNNLSVVDSVTGTKSLIKVAGISDTDIQNIDGLGVVLTWHLREDLPALRLMLQTPEWEQPEI